MPGSPSSHLELLLVGVRWPVGLLMTSAAYMWRTTPIHRRELPGRWEDDRPPAVTAETDLSGVQHVEEGFGDFLRRRYRIRLRGTGRPAAAIMADLKADPNRVAPGTLAHFAKTQGAPWDMRLGDEFVVRMPGPWDGPVRVVDITPMSFRFATLEGHIEAGFIEWRARDDGDVVVFEIESWSRPGDRLSDIAHHKLRMAKEVQLHMWTSVLEEVADREDARRDGPLDIDTRRIDM